jgi:UDP-N-acetylglucosamine 4,6-dehydratase/5-epimerase
MNNKKFKNKIFLITGGTGSFGNAVLSRLLELDIAEVRIFSRDEKKQDDMRRKYSDIRIKFYLGDVREYESIINAIRGVDYVFHSAALKQVPSCEFHPIEAVKTNVMGTENVLTAAINTNVKRVICLSTDKAVYPINAMGISKALMEKVFLAKSRQESSNTVICGTRYGNVLASRGSVIPLFLDLISNNQELTITDPSMTRFMMTLEDAVELVFFAFENAKPGDIFVQKAPAVKIGTLAKALCEIMGKVNHPIRIIGTRHGEKKYESLLSREEMASAHDLAEGYYRIPIDMRDLNYSKYIDIGEESITKADGYNSENTEQLDCEGMKSLLTKLSIIKAAQENKEFNPEN